jgi:hypothetical protein
MPANVFSEFTFGFAFTQEVTTLCWEALAGAPEMPSLFDEGHGKGFDVSLGLWGWTLFAQFKRGSLLTRSTALQWDSYNNDYYRFEIYPSSRSSQHGDLVRLEAKAIMHWVAYVAPVFHTSFQLNSHFGDRHVLDNVRMISPGAIGALDDQIHYVTYQTCFDAPIVHSEPRRVSAMSVEGLRGRLGLMDWRRPVDRTSDATRDDPVLLDDAYFDGVTEVMIQVAADGHAAQSAARVLRDVGSMTSFGRARTVGRLLFGAELLPLPATGQEVG